MLHPEVSVTAPYPITGFPLGHSIKDSYTIPQHPFEPSMELWSIAGKGFPVIFTAENSDSAPFSHRSRNTGNVSSNDSDAYLQVARTAHSYVQFP